MFVDSPIVEIARMLQHYLSAYINLSVYSTFPFNCLEYLTFTSLREPSPEVTITVEIAVIGPKIHIQELKSHESVRLKQLSYDVKGQRRPFAPPIRVVAGFTLTSFLGQLS